MTVRVTLRTPHWDAEGRLYRPGERDVPVEVAEAWGYAKAGPVTAPAPSEDETQTEGAGPGPVETTTPLPDEFPARDLLIAGGVMTLDAVRAASDHQLRQIKGIGPAAVRNIRAALA